jgi:hypothetical protein
MRMRPLLLANRARQLPVRKGTTAARIGGSGLAVQISGVGGGCGAGQGRCGTRGAGQRGCRDCGAGQRGCRDCGAGQRDGRSWVQARAVRDSLRKSLAVQDLPCRSGRCGGSCASQRQGGLAVGAAGNAAEFEPVPAAARPPGMSVWAGLYGGGVGTGGRPEELQVRRGTGPGRSGPSGPGEPKATPRMQKGTQRFFDRSFSGGNLRGPLYKGPLVQ